MPLIKSAKLVCIYTVHVHVHTPSKCNNYYMYAVLLLTRCLTSISEPPLMA